MIDDRVNDFVSIIFNEYFKSTKEKLFSKLSEKQNLKKASKSLYVFLTTLDEVEKYGKIMKSNYSDNCVHLYNAELRKNYN